jgi:hypothetical protein
MPISLYLCRHEIVSRDYAITDLHELSSFTSPQTRQAVSGPGLKRGTIEVRSHSVVTLGKKEKHSHFTYKSSADHIRSYGLRSVSIWHTKFASYNAFLGMTIVCPFSCSVSVSLKRDILVLQVGGWAWG